MHADNDNDNDNDMHADNDNDNDNDNDMHADNFPPAFWEVLCSKLPVCVSL